MDADASDPMSTLLYVYHRIIKTMSSSGNRFFSSYAKMSRITRDDDFFDAFRPDLVILENRESDGLVVFYIGENEI